MPTDRDAAMEALAREVAEEIDQGFDCWSPAEEPDKIKSILLAAFVRVANEARADAEREG